MYPTHTSAILHSGLPILLTAILPPLLLDQNPQHLLQLPHLPPQFPNLQRSLVILYITLRTVNLLLPPFTFKIHRVSHLLPFLDRVIIYFSLVTILTDFP